MLQLCFFFTSLCTSLCATYSLYIVTSEHSPGFKRNGNVTKLHFDLKLVVIVVQLIVFMWIAELKSGIDIFRLGAGIGAKITVCCLDLGLQRFFKKYQEMLLIIITTTTYKMV